MACKGNVRDRGKELIGIQRKTGLGFASTIVVKLLARKT